LLTAAWYDQHRCVFALVARSERIESRPRLR
jgi:hypothetical protein